MGSRRLELPRAHCIGSMHCRAPLSSHGRRDAIGGKIRWARGEHTPQTPPVNVVSPRAPTFPCRDSLFAAGKTLPVFGNFFPFAFHGTFLFTAGTGLIPRLLS
jgi:hypothetical protein